MVEISTIMVATDFSEASASATAFAFDLARALNAHLFILHVVPEYDVQLMSAVSGQLQSHIEPDALIQTYYEDADKRLSELLEKARIDDLVQERLIVTGEPVEEIVNWAASKQAQLLIVGTHGRSGLERFMLGSVAERVLRKAGCAVIVVPAAKA